jgi:hypothetical protein
MQVTVPGGRLRALTRLAAMPGQKRVAGALAVAAAAVAISACGSGGSDKVIPPAKSQILQSRLSAVELAVSEGHCNVAQARAQRFVDAVNQLPDTVGTTDKETLRNAGENLQKLAQQPSQCEPAPIGTSGTQGAQTTSTTSTVVPTTPTATTTTSTTSAPPPGNSGGNQGGGPPTGTPPGQGNTGGGDTGGGQTGGGGAAGGGGGTGSGGTGGTGVGGGGGTG